MNRFLFSILFITIFFSCRKENSNEFITDPNNPYNDTAWAQTISSAAPVNEIFKILSPPPQTGVCNPATGGTVNINDGVQVTFPANIFLYPSVTGTVNVEIDYLKSKGDMIRFGRSTTSNGRLLESGGAFNIKVFQSGEPLQLTAGSGIEIWYPYAQPDSTMRLFYGDTITSAASSNFTWLPANSDSSGVFAVKREDTSGIVTGYQIISQKFNWINCDKFSDTSKPRTTVSAILPVNFTNKNTAVFIVFKNIFSVAYMDADVNNHLFNYNNIPVGSIVTLVSISKIGTDLYLGTKQITVMPNAIVDMSPEKKTEQEISDYLNSL